MRKAVCAGLGLAAGAAIGVLLPSTEMECRFMGEASGRMKRAGAPSNWEKAVLVDI
ncbi:MAG: hypothetical protein WA624_23540 [Methylocella sp.]